MQYDMMLYIINPRLPCIERQDVLYQAACSQCYDHLEDDNLQVHCVSLQAFCCAVWSCNSHTVWSPVDHHYGSRSCYNEIYDEAAEAPSVNYRFTEHTELFIGSLQMRYLQ